MKKLGTHNSLSYLPCQWWLRPFAWIGRCQSLTIEEQYNLGVRYFDIRVKFDKNGSPISGHGLLTYQVDVDSILKYLNSKKDNIVIRLFLENTKRDPRKYDHLYRDYIKYWQQAYPYLYFVEGGCRYDYKNFITKNINTRTCYAEYWKKKFCIPFPKKWAKKNNPELHKSDSDAIYSVYDFVQL